MLLKPENDEIDNTIIIICGDCWDVPELIGAYWLGRSLQVGKASSSTYMIEHDIFVVYYS